MQTYLVMGLFLLVYATITVIGIRRRTEKDTYFSVDDTNVLKGLWCIIIVLVHVPDAYQNRIQDLIGSFAYIGVTFFFMTSAYGLKYGIEHKKNYLHNFWSKRLPKLLIPAFLINILSVLNSTLLGGNDFNPLSLIYINKWVLVLLLFYFAFWVANSIKCNDVCGGGYLPDCIVCIVVISYSLISYFVVGEGWFTECYGFIYGLILARVVDKYEAFGEKKWVCKLCISVMVGLILGLAYLKFKPVPFFGNYVLKLLLGIALTHAILLFSIRIKVGNKVSRFLGGISYEVYLLHGVAFAFLKNIAPGLESGIFIVLAIILTVAVSAFIRWVSECINKGLYRIIKNQK